MSQEIISEIQEYTIMYTYNVVQKLKKWNDGKLKYFKFNNKVQIFNEESILITQQFLKNDKQLLESNWGNEFKVGGVLITIECMSSESKRDLTKMFKKDTVTPKTNIIYSKSQIPKNHQQVSRTTLKELHVGHNVQSPSVLGMKRRRVGLSKSMTPSRRMQAPTTTTTVKPPPPPVRNESNTFNSSNEESTTPVIIKRRVGQKKLTPKPKPVLSVDELNLLRSNEEGRIKAVETPVVDKRTITSNSVLSKTLDTPISTKSTKKTLQLDELNLNTPNLISSDKYLLLRPSSTPDKQDQINWDDESVFKSNSKIQTSLKSLITPKPTPRPMKRITNNRNKREVIKIPQPRIPLSELSHTNTMTPSKIPSKVEVYASDESEYDEIKSQSQDLENLGKITQTETYHYGSKSKAKGLKVSDISKL